MLPVTKRDLTIRRAVVRYMVRQYRQARTANNLRNLMMFVAHRHNYVYDDSPIPCPVRRF